jgi:hypothetical protein
MYEQVRASFRKGDAVAIVFNCPAGYWHLSKILEINPYQWVAKSEVIFVLSKPLNTPYFKIDVGTIVIPHLDCIREFKTWSETYLHKSWPDVLCNVIRINELLLKDYQYQLGLLEFGYQNEKTLKPYASQIYNLQVKINKTTRAINHLRSVIPIQQPQLAN